MNTLVKTNDIDAVFMVLRITSSACNQFVFTVIGFGTMSLSGALNSVVYLSVLSR